MSGFRLAPEAEAELDDPLSRVTRTFMDGMLTALKLSAVHP